jgi:protein TonB
VPPRHLGLDGDYLPVVKVAPVYPQAARKERIEGFVVVEFSVGSNGLTQQARVVEASPPDIFDRAALAAVSKFRYKPRVVDGDPVAVTGVRNRITFVLNDG